MQVELSGDNLTEEIDEQLFQRWKRFLTVPEQTVYRKLHDLITEGLGVTDSKDLAAACGMRENRLFNTILPKLQGLGLANLSRED